MTIISYLTVIEMLIFNLYTLDRCCHRKHSSFKTFLTFFLFSAAFFIILYCNSITFKANGRLLILGIVFLLPINYLYKDHVLVLLVLMCSIWIYTSGVLSLSIQAVSLMGSASPFCVLVLESLLFGITIVPFNKILVPKYAFVLQNIKNFDEKWYKYLAMDTCLGFVTLVIFHAALMTEKTSPIKILATVLLLFYIIVSYFILYKIVIDSMKYKQLKHTAMHDPLTGLANRIQLWENLNSLVKSEETFSILFIDLDKFKQINDQYGHLTGDLYLKHFSDIASRIFHENGTVYRFGGDEFVAIYYGLIPQATIDRLTQCREWDPGAPCPFNQLSTGILFCRPPHPTAEELLHQVDELMYQNKLKKHTS